MAPPPPLEWDPRLETGFHDIDDQHQRMIERLGTLLEAIEEGRSPEVVVPLSDFLVDYISRHIETEEAIMQAMGYPDFQEHKRIHDEFIVEAMRVTNRLADKNPVAEVLAEIETKIVQHILNHIATTDAKMAAWFRTQGSTGSAG